MWSYWRAIIHWLIGAGMLPSPPPSSTLMPSRPENRLLRRASLWDVYCTTHFGRTPGVRSDAVAVIGQARRTLPCSTLFLSIPHSGVTKYTLICVVCFSITCLCPPNIWLSFSERSVDALHDASTARTCTSNLHT